MYSKYAFDYQHTTTLMLRYAVSGLSVRSQDSKSKKERKRPEERNTSGIIIFLFMYRSSTSRLPMELHGNSAQQVMSRVGLCYLIGSRIDKSLATTGTLRVVRCDTAKKRYLVLVSHC